MVGEINSNQMRELCDILFGDSFNDLHISKVKLAIERYENLKKQTRESKKTCCVCGTTKNVGWVGGSIPYRCASPDCVPF